MNKLKAETRYFQFNLYVMLSHYFALPFLRLKTICAQFPNDQIVNSAEERETAYILLGKIMTCCMSAAEDSAVLGIQSLKVMPAVLLFWELVVRCIFR